jgi:hypothetical protein
MSLSGDLQGGTMRPPKQAPGAKVNVKCRNCKRMFPAVYRKCPFCKKAQAAK